MAQRQEARDSLDDFPTQQWGTRALVEYVIGPALRRAGHIEMLAHLRGHSVWEPASNRGFMVRPLREYFGIVRSSDVHDYGDEAVDCQDAVFDFLIPGLESPCIRAQGIDWIITNPPFRLADQFARRALDLRPREGVALLVRTGFLEGCGRWEALFQPHPPTIVAQFVERLPMVRGRCDPDASTATAYCWLVWLKGFGGATTLTWIPPCRRALERPGDYEVTASMEAAE
ncbi:SAM-dependent DNA methyltransferase [Marinibaculum pumilum]|uniref:SAM-dependent DNA methyltransferase n=1 Tax=Marinibaculum pumilum TaxID=1766165 RepID=A0ABV7KYH2_9PROT